MIKNEFVEIFNAHFNDTNLPNQLKHGARLVGRWMAPKEDTTTEVFAIWEYDSLEKYKEIEANVRNDREHVQRIMEWYDMHGGREYVFKKYLIEIRDEPIISTLKIS